MNDDDHRDPTQGQAPGGDTQRPENLRDTGTVPSRADGFGVEANRGEYALGDEPAAGVPENYPPQVNGVALARYTSGPLPSVEDFHGYDRVLPGAADRILRMAEDQTRAQIDAMSANADVERSISESIASNAKRKDREQWIFAVLAFAALGAALVFAWNDKPIPAVVGLIVLAAAGYKIGRGGSDSQFISPVPDQVENAGS